VNSGLVTRRWRAVLWLRGSQGRALARVLSGRREQSKGRLRELS
jgi:hypothetical protein